MFVKGEHQRQFAYEAHTACDKNGFVLETVVTPGNVHDSVAFDDVYDKLVENFPETMNLKKLAKWKWKRNNTPSNLLVFIVNLINMKKNPIFA